MDRIVVIANPVASQFTGGSHRDVMATLTRTHPVEAVWPSSAAEAQAAAATVAAEGAAVVVAMGGDGMVHHVAQGLVGTEAALGVIPTGTTNVVARLLDIPSKPVRAARRIAQSPEARRIGVARMELSRGSTVTVHHAIFACGFGLDAEVVIQADRDPYRKYRFGSIHYARTSVSVGLRRFPSRRPHLSVQSGERHTMATTVLVQFRDVYTYFGKIPLRLGEQTPGPMTLLTLGRLRRWRIPQIAANAMLGRDLGRVKEMDVWPGVETVELSADPPVAAQADGESLGMVDGGRVEWMPQALRVITG